MPHKLTAAGTTADLGLWNHGIMGLWDGNLQPGKSAATGDTDEAEYSSAVYYYWVSTNISQ